MEFNVGTEILRAKLHRLVVKFYLDFLCFHLCSVGLNITKCAVMSLLYYIVEI